MTVRSHRSLIGVLAAGALSIPLLSAAVAAPPKKPAKPAAKPAAAKGDPKKGKDQFKSEGCGGCHKTKDFTDAAATTGPDLAAIGKERTPAQLEASIHKPKRDSVMPAFKGPQATLNNLVAYLGTQK